MRPGFGEWVVARGAAGCAEVACGLLAQPGAAEPAGSHSARTVGRDAVRHAVGIVADGYAVPRHASHPVGSLMEPMLRVRRYGVGGRLVFFAVCAHWYAGVFRMDARRMAGEAFAALCGCPENVRRCLPDSRAAFYLPQLLSCLAAMPACESPPATRLGFGITVRSLEEATRC